MIRNRELAVLMLVAVLLAVSCTVLCTAFPSAAGPVCCAGFVLVGAAFFVFTKRRYRDIAALSDFLRDAAGGGAIQSVPENAEGELNILWDDAHKLALRLSEQASRLREEKNTLNDTLSDISHQLKTPVTSLIVMADLLEQEDLSDEKRREFVCHMQTSLARIDWLVRSLLKMASLDAGAERLRREKTNLFGVVEKAIIPVKVTAESRSQEIVLDFDEELTMVCDANWTAEALTNIIKNASDHTPEGGRITVDAGVNPVCVWVRVRDTGPGIDSADLPHLFRRFYKGRYSAKDSIGIGLAMSLSVMRSQNGDIEAKTERGGGASFTLKFYM